MFFNTGKYGCDPTRCSQARIGSRVWGWCGSQPDSIAFEMWTFLTEGAEVASRIAQWPDRASNYREKPVYVKRSKIATYNTSLGLQALIWAFDASADPWPASPMTTKPLRPSSLYKRCLAL